MGASKKDKKQRRKNSLAARSDKHKLYEKSVQNVEAEIDFVDGIYSKLRRRKASTLREDFCGTAKAACEWVRRRRDNLAFGVDLDPDVLEWGRTHNLARLRAEQRERVRLVNGNVLRAATDPVDIVLAMNFSYWVFKERATMKRYFRRIHAALSDDGIFFLDGFGGYEAYQELRENTRHRKFTYVWEQERFNPISGEILCHIHFKFPDGSRMKRAFTYDWRLWSLPELTELLTESGFSPVVYWEGTAKDGSGNGIFKPATSGEADAGWIAYIVATKQPRPPRN